MNGGGRSAAAVLRNPGMNISLAVPAFEEIPGAQQYFEENGVGVALQEALQKLLAEQPRNSIARLCELLQEGEEDAKLHAMALKYGLLDSSATFATPKNSRPHTAPSSRVQPSATGMDRSVVARSGAREHGGASSVIQTNTTTGGASGSCSGGGGGYVASEPLAVASGPGGPGSGDAAQSASMSSTPSEPVAPVAPVTPKAAAPPKGSPEGGRRRPRAAGSSRTQSIDQAEGDLGNADSVTS